MTAGNGKILLLGATGLLGSTLAPFLLDRGHTIETHGASGAAAYRVDLRIRDRAEEMLQEARPNVIVNMVGLTDVDGCEREPHQAYLVNVKIVENISAWMKQWEGPCHLVHISTDHVYDGNCEHKEEDVTLTNYYSFSKYAGELAASAVKSTVVRTNFFGRSRCAKRTSLTDWLYSSLRERRSIRVFEDIWFSPLSMATLSEIIEMIIVRKPVGLFNVGSRAGMSKADFAYAFADEVNLPAAGMERSSSADGTSLKTYRPKNMRMNCFKCENELSITLPTLHDEIKRAAKEYL